jgi:hypothetical protein
VRVATIRIRIDLYRAAAAYRVIQVCELSIRTSFPGELNALQ